MSAGVVIVRSGCHIQKIVDIHSPGRDSFFFEGLVQGEMLRGYSATEACLLYLCVSLKRLAHVKANVS